MKKLLLISFLTSSLSIFAQTEQGTWMIQGGTNLSFNGAAIEYEYDGESLEGSKTSVKAFEFKPAVNYFVANNLAIGLNLELSETNTDNNGSENSSLAFAVMPQVKYFFGSSKTRPYLGAELGLMSATTSWASSQDTFSGLGYGLSGGAAIFLSNNVSLNLGLEFEGSSMKLKEDDRVKMNIGGFGMTAGFSIFL